MKSILAAVAALVAFSALVPAQTIAFSGRAWNVKTSSGRVGPGPNYFSSGASNVWVDAGGRLHLKIARSKGRWYCAEVVAAESLGYGTYRFLLDTPVNALDPNVVLGLFTWNDDPAYNHREIDIEFSRWSSPSNQNAQYVVQPYTLASNIHRFNEPSGLSSSTHAFQWLPTAVSFLSASGLQPDPPAPASIAQQWAETSGVPVPGGEHARMNLWLNQGKAPTNGLPAEVVVERFEFVSP
jgi:hypothetical protein